jgi:hypothetical protein
MMGSVRYAESYKVFYLFLKGEIHLPVGWEVCRAPAVLVKTRNSCAKNSPVRAGSGLRARRPSSFVSILGRGKMFSFALKLPCMKFVRGIFRRGGGGGLGLEGSEIFHFFPFRDEGKGGAKSPRHTLPLTDQLKEETLS